MSAPSSNKKQVTGRPALIVALGAQDAGEAVRIVNASSLPRRHRVRYRDLIGYLEGRPVKELAQEGSVSTKMIHVRIRAAARQVTLEQVSAGAPDQLIRSLSVRAANCLFNENLNTDQAVRDRVLSQGAMSLLMAPNMGRKSYQEVCDAFGFDPADPVRPAETGLSADKRLDTPREAGPLQAALLRSVKPEADEWDPYL
jgi:hypothetical protein